MRVPSFFAPLATTMPDGVDRVRNLIPEHTGDTERPYRFRRRPGLRVFASGLHGPVRGGVELDGSAYVMAGERFYGVASTGEETEIGEIDPDTRPATMITNGTAGNQVAGVSGGKLWCLDDGTFGEVEDADLPDDILGVVHTDTYAVAWFRNSRAFRISSLLDFTAWAGGDAAERSQYVDNIVAIIADQTELTILGSQTQETWWNSGNNAFPFEPVQNALSRQGAAGTHGAVLVGDTPYWVSKSPEGMGPVLRIRSGYTPERISTHAIERKISALAVVSDMYASSLEIEGHRFYLLTFPSADVTLAFDEAVEPAVAWAEWSYHEPYWGTREAFLGRCHFYAFGKHLVGSRRDGTIYELAFDAYDDAGDVIRWERRFRGPTNDGKRVFLGEQRLDATKGVGLLSGQGSDPQVMLQKSRDDGKTWGPERWKGLGERGDYGHRARWSRGGAADQPAWWLAGTDPVITELNDFHVDAQGGAH